MEQQGRHVRSSWKDRGGGSVVSVERADLVTHLRQLYGDLFAVIDRDPEQEILGIALPVVDCIITAAREAMTSSASPEPPAGLTIRIVDLISPAAVEAGVPIRALDAWIVVGQVLAALGEPSRASVASARAL